MEELGVISKVSEPIEWCAGMAVVPKASGKVRICADLKREKFIHNQVLILLWRSWLTQSKLGTNSGF